MIVTLASTFEIANGIDRLAQILTEERFSVQQQTQVVTKCRADWLAGFHSRASRSVPLRYVVTFPACESLEAAYVQARTIPLSCPKGGVLTEQVGDVVTTFADSWIEGAIGVERLGVTNRFTFNLTAVDPNTFTPNSFLSTLNMNYTANLYFVTGLTGGDNTKLDGYATTDVLVGFAAFLPGLLIGGVPTAKMFQLITGTAAENADPAAGKLIIRPDDFDADTNPKVWEEKL
jgi:hypothetical protein